MQILSRDILISLVMVLMMIVITGLRSPKSRFCPWKTVCILVFTFVIGVIFSLTGISPISGFGLRNFGQGINLIPFAGIADILSQGMMVYSVINIVGNVLMFAPIGFFAPILCKKYEHLSRTVLVGASISLLIECSQLFLARGTDIDDLILNTLGAVIGYGCYRWYQRLFPSLSKKIAEANAQNTPKVFWVCVWTTYIVIVIGGFYDRFQFGIHSLW